MTIYHTDLEPKNPDVGDRWMKDNKELIYTIKGWCYIDDLGDFVIFEDEDEEAFNRAMGIL